MVLTYDLVTEEVNPTVHVESSSLVPLHLLRLLDLALIRARSFGLRHNRLRKGEGWRRRQVLQWGCNKSNSLPVLRPRWVFPWGIEWKVVGKGRGRFPWIDSCRGQLDMEQRVVVGVLVLVVAVLVCVGSFV